MMSVGRVLFVLLAGAAVSARAQDAIPPVTQTVTTAQEGCAGDAAQLCQAASSPSDRAQCLQANQSTVSPSCQAALAQTPASGIAKHLGFDPQPTAPQDAAQPTDLPNFVPPQTPVYPGPTSTDTPPRPPRVAPTIVLAQPSATTAAPTPAATNPPLQ